MAPDIPTQFSFEELLSHTFPGFFAAITVFMLTAIWSPRDITSWATKDLSSFVQVVGFVIIFGTILGIIIDGIHHSIIEDNIFEKITGLKIINESLNALYPGAEELKLGYGYFFKLMTTDKSDPITTFKYLQSSMYRYSEFYANTFISLIPFSLIAPLYLSYVLQIPWIYSLIIASMSLFIACACLNSSYVALKEYQKTKLSVLCGYSGYDYYIDLRACQRDFNWTEKIELQARIFDRANKQVEKEGIEVIFNSTFGCIEPSNGGKTDDNGVASATLRCVCDKCGTAIVTATSKGPNKDPVNISQLCSSIFSKGTNDTANPNGCVPGVTWVHIRRG
jgi:hypothetical protein